MERLQEAVIGVAPSAIQEIAILRRLFGSAFDSAIGPSYQGHLDPEKFRPVLAPAGIRIDRVQEEGIREFMHECDPEEWEHGALEPEASDLIAPRPQSSAPASHFLLAIPSGLLSAV